MAAEVKFAIPERQIDNTGVRFTRRHNDSMHGTLVIRQNFLDWRPSGNEFVYEVTWEAFARFAEENGKRIKPKAKIVRARKKLTKTAA